MCDPLQLGRPRTFRLLLWLHVAVVLLFCYVQRDDLGSDHPGYLALAEGILHGEYSMWWDLAPPIPDTMRSPGYPLFLAAILATGGGIPLIQFTQAALYLASVAILLRCVKDLGGDRRARSLFLLLLLPSIQFLYYAPTVFPEIPMVFLIALIMRTTTALDHRWWPPVLLGLLFGLGFAIRPVVLFLPFLWAGIIVLRRTPGSLRQALLLCATFLVSTVPYGLWNHRNHGVFSITPLEGGAGVMHMGWWSGMIPGHCEHWYWNNCAAVELIRFAPADGAHARSAAFEEQWRTIDAALRPWMTRTDSTMLGAWADRRSVFRTYSTGYTLERERLLKQAVMEEAADHPLYTLAYKAYSALRLWVTGIQLDQWQRAGLSGRLKQLYPFVLTLATFILGCWASVRLWRTHRSSRSRLVFIWSALIYFGAIHIPFVIQSRYTIPVRMLLLVLIALALARRPAPEEGRTEGGPVNSPEGA